MIQLLSNGDLNRLRRCNCVIIIIGVVTTVASLSCNFLTEVLSCLLRHFELDRLLFQELLCCLLLLNRSRNIGNDNTDNPLGKEDQMLTICQYPYGDLWCDYDDDGGWWYDSRICYLEEYDYDQHDKVCLSRIWVVICCNVPDGIVG